MKSEREKVFEEKLDTVIEPLRYLVAVEMSSLGVSHAAIGKKVRVAKATVGKMLSGIKKEIANEG